MKELYKAPEMDIMSVLTDVIRTSDGEFNPDYRDEEGGDTPLGPNA